MHTALWNEYWLTLNASVFVVDIYDRGFACLCSYILCHLTQIMLE